MQAYCVNSLLAKLVALTRERDDIALEIALIKTLSDFVASIDDKPAISVVIYHLKDISNPVISVLTADERIAETTIEEPLRQAIIDCFQSGEIGTHQGTEQTVIKIIPLKNPAGQVSSAIKIELPHADMHLEVTINMLLQIYQNFTRLINDNESDTLTGLLNRKSFEHRIGKIFTQMHSITKREEDKPNQAYFLAIFDIDHFKRVNDEFGHLIGDEVLLLFSQLMQQSFRDTDPLFRFGGEEFVGVFACSHANDIEVILERLRLKVEQFAFPQVGKVTVSSGYTAISGFDTSSQLIDRADSALYFAKNNGRNRVAFYEQLIADGLLEEAKKEGDIEFF